MPSLSQGHTASHGTILVLFPMPHLALHRWVGGDSWGRKEGRDIWLRVGPEAALSILRTEASVLTRNPAFGQKGGGGGRATGATVGGLGRGELGSKNNSITLHLSSLGTQCGKVDQLHCTDEETEGPERGSTLPKATQLEKRRAGV